KLTALPSGPLVPEPSSPVGEKEPAAEQTDSAGAYFAEVPLASITPNPKQPREVFDEDALAELVTSIKEVGLLQPVVVRKVA
ncbi:ParB N-terminal domain-containing protein, partial [Streptomyces sp. JAC25]